MSMHHSAPDASVAPAARRQVAYPGELGAASTALAFCVPAQWSTQPATGALAMVRAPTPNRHGFHANLVLSVDRVSDATTLWAAGRSVLADARRRASGLVVVGEGVTEVAERPALRREQRLDAAGVGGTLVQLVLILLAAVPGAGRDCIQMTVTGAGDERALIAQVLDDVCASLTLGG